MLVPFLFDLTNTKIHGLIWGSESGDSTAEDNPYAPSPAPLTPIILEAWTVVSDADNGQLQFGTYDLTADTFTANDDIKATGVASGGITHVPCDGIRLAISATVVPAIKLTGSATSINIAGDVQFHIPGRTQAESLAAIAVANVGFILTEQGDTLDDESDSPLQME